MNDTPFVEVKRDNGRKEQWGVGLLYRREGRKNVLNSKTVIILSIVFLFMTLVLSMILDNKPAETSEKSSIQLREEFSNLKEIDIPFYFGDSDDKGDSYRSKAKSKNVTHSDKLSGGIQLIKRENLNLIPPGALVKANLVSGASNGLVRAQVVDSLSINGETIIPSGATLIGNGSSTEKRLFVQFRQLVLKDGSFSQIEAQACDSSDQIPGLKGTLIGYQTLKLSAAIGLNFASGLSQGLQDTKVQGGVATKPPTIKNGLLNGASSAALDQSRDLMSEIKNKAPIIEVPKGTEICVIFGSGG